MFKSACESVSWFNCEGGRNIDSFHQRLRKKTAGGCTDDSEAKGIYCCSWGPKFGAQNKHWEAHKPPLGVSLQRYVCYFPFQEEGHLSANILILFLDQGYRVLPAPIFFSLLKFFWTCHAMCFEAAHPASHQDNRHTDTQSVHHLHAYKKENWCVSEMP